MARRNRREQLRRVVVESNLEQAIELVNSRAGARAYSAAQLFRTQLLQNLAGQRHGRRYLVPGTKHRYYTASAPGEYPAVRLGMLRQGCYVYMVSTDTGGAAAVVGVMANYAAELEKRRPQAGGRPFFRRTYNEVRDEMKKRMGAR